MLTYEMAHTAWPAPGYGQDSVGYRLTVTRFEVPEKLRHHLDPPRRGAHRCPLLAGLLEAVWFMSYLAPARLAQR
jgi:hypothetical protein